MGVEVQVQSFFILDVHIDVSAQFVAMGAQGKDTKVPTGLGIGWAKLKAGEKKHFCAAQVQP
jgi:hypothetical protein